MDSMRSLNSSLPGPGHSAKHEDPARLLAAFKAAALSVTNLYKSAAADQGRARSEGYQDALDELLTYLDKENIGLSDGEGWRIRRWATERLDGRTPTVESDDEVSDNHKATDRSSSPVLQRADPSPATRVPASNPTRTVSPVRTESVPLPASVPINVESAPAASFVPPQATFTFRSSHQNPQDADIILSDVDLSDNTRTPDAGANRPLRTRYNARPGSRPTTTTIGRAAGQKRKINFGEFFDIGNLGQGRDREGFGGAGGGGGKRSRPA